MTSLTANYIAIPRRLISDLRDNPLAIALYYVLARLYLIEQKPVPLSRGDVQRLDPSLKIGSIARALDHLTDAGWLLETPGYKSGYRPSWGQSRTGQAYVWQIGTRLLGCPDGLWSTAVRISCDLLDVFVGKIQPQPRFPAEVHGYFISAEQRHVALLSMLDIGSYIRCSAGMASTPTQALHSWGLVRDGQAQPIFATTTLTLASQRTSISGYQLTNAAWHRLGFSWERPQTTSAAMDSGQLLIFLPNERIAPLIEGRIAHQIGDLIGQVPPADTQRSAAACGQTPSSHAQPPMTWNQKDLIDSKEPTTKGGGSLSDVDRRRPTEPKRQADQIYAPESHQISLTDGMIMLKNYGVQSATRLRALAGMPAVQIEPIISYARERQLGPGWVVQTACRAQAGEPLSELLYRPPQHIPVDWAEQARISSDIARRGDDLTGLDCTEHEPSLAELLDQLRQDLCMCHERIYHRVIQKLSFCVAADAVYIQCQSVADRMTVLNIFMPALRSIVQDLGLPATICVTDQ